VKWLVKIADGEHQVEIEAPRSAEGLRVAVDGREVVVDVSEIDQGGLSLLVDRRSYTVDFDRRTKGLSALVGGQEQSLWPLSVIDERQALSAAGRSTRAEQGPLAVTAPMPGKVVRLMVRAGDEVKAEQGLVIVEAMKMENELKSPRAGRIAEVSVKEGSAVEGGQKLCVLE
jgi:biotin carboxyl carrier protein